MATLFEHCQLLEQAIQNLKEAIRAEVQTHGGRMPIGDGREIVLTLQKRTTINFAANEQVLRQHLGPRFYECVKVRVGDLLKRVRDRAPEGEKDRAVAKLMEALADAGALTTKPMKYKLVLRRIKATNKKS